MEEQFKKQIGDIIVQMECPKGFECAQSGFEALCNARELMAVENYLECLEDNSVSMACKFSISYGLYYFCRCPLRVYIEKNCRKG